MTVEAHVEAFANEVADHGAGPEARGEAGGQWAAIDERCQLLPLILAEPRRIPGRLARQQSIGAFGVEPLQPSIDRPAGDVELPAQRDDRLLREVAQHRLGPAPGDEISSLLGIPEELAQTAKLAGSAPTGTDCLPILRASHDHLLSGRDRALLIRRLALVNQGMDRVQRDPV